MTFRNKNFSPVIIFFFVLFIFLHHHLGEKMPIFTVGKNIHSCLRKNIFHCFFQVLGLNDILELFRYKCCILTELYWIRFPIEKGPTFFTATTRSFFSVLSPRLLVRETDSHTCRNFLFDSLNILKIFLKKVFINIT